MQNSAGNFTRLNHKEMTAHIRKRIKASGIKARVRMLETCGSKAIQVNVPQYMANG